MFPRKRARPGPADSTTSLPANAIADRAMSPSATTRTEPAVEGAKSSETNGAPAKEPAKQQVRKSRSLFSLSKSAPSTQVAKENITGGTLKAGSTPDFSRFETKRNPGSSGDSDSIRTLPQIPEPSSKDAEAEAGDDTTTDGPDHNREPATLEQNMDGAAHPPAKTVPSQASTGWLGGWFGGGSTAPEQHPISQGQEGSAAEEDTPESPAAPTNEAVPPPTPTVKTLRHQSSWFGPWFGTTATMPASPPTDAPKDAPKASNEDTAMPDAVPAAPAPASAPTQPPASSTWAFWSRDAGANPTAKSTTSTEQGELAVVGESSERSPKQSSGVEVKDNASTKEPPLKRVAKEAIARTGSIRSKRVRSTSIEADEPSRPSTPTSTRTTIPPPDSSSVVNISPPNLLLPSFKTTYRQKQNPTIISQIKQLLLRTAQPPADHVYLVKDPPKIKKALAIGIHGLFPNAYLRQILGPPTGTSVRFSNHAADAIRRWHVDTHGNEDIEIEKVALEFEGKVLERVDNLWKLLLNWIEHIKNADFILFACHSQGVPVGVMLLAKLIELGLLNTARVGICAMAGVSLGPFQDYKSTMGMLSTAGAELWQFSSPETEISIRYREALQVVLKYGARVTYAGSIDDQLVPLSSAIFSPANHPYIYRAVFIDGRIHAPDFIAHLVGFALKLRNLGISDHGLISELSVALAGSLYGGEGHSRVYDETKIYDLAVAHTLETTVVDNVPCRFDKEPGTANANPYVLPWIMRGLLEEDFVRSELSNETAELLKQFDEWKPVTKALKDVKYRLEAVRSKL